MKSLDKMAEMVGAGVGGSNPAGGIGGADSLAAMSSMTGSSGAAPAGMGDVATGAFASQSASAGAGAGAASTAPSVPSNGSIDALGAGTQAGSGASAAGSEPSEEGKNHPWNVMGDQLGNLASTKDDIARHEGSTGGGIQIRLNHME